RHVRGHHPPDELPHALEIAEEECVILDNRPADGEAILVATEDRFVRIVGRRWREQVSSVQRFVAQKLEYRPVQFIPAGFGRQVYDAAVEASEFRWRRVDLDLKFLDRVDHRVEGDLPRFGLEN